MLSCYVVPSFQRHKLPVLGPPAWIGHRETVWPAWMNATQKATNATPKACLLDSTGLPRGGHFLHFLFYFFLSVLSPPPPPRKGNKASVGLKEVWHVRQHLRFFSQINFPLPFCHSSVYSYTHAQKIQICQILYCICSVQPNPTRFLSNLNLTSVHTITLNPTNMLFCCISSLVPSQTSSPKEVVP